MQFESIICLILGGSLGVLLRLYILKKINFQIGLSIDNIAIINIISAFLTGIFISFNYNNKLFYMFFSIGFLGCFSSFSSFIYKLFSLIEAQRYVHFIKYYIENIIYTIILFSIGYYFIKIVLN